MEAANKLLIFDPYFFVGNISLVHSALLRSNPSLTINCFNGPLFAIHKSLKFLGTTNMWVTFLTSCEWACKMLAQVNSASFSSTSHNQTDLSRLHDAMKAPEMSKRVFVNDVKIYKKKSKIHIRTMLINHE